MQIIQIDSNVWTAVIPLFSTDQLSLLQPIKSLNLPFSIATWRLPSGERHKLGCDINRKLILIALMATRPGVPRLDEYVHSTRLNTFGCCYLVRHERCVQIRHLCHGTLATSSPRLAWHCPRLAYCSQQGRKLLRSNADWLCWYV
jgi:hypothetical protein